MWRNWLRQIWNGLLTAVLIVSLLSVPVHCAMVDHPHSLFVTPDAMRSARAESSTTVHGGHAGMDHSAGTDGASALPVPGMLWDRVAADPVFDALPTTDVSLRDSQAARATADEEAAVSAGFPVVQQIEMTMLSSTFQGAVLLMAMLWLVQLLRTNPLPRATPLLSHIFTLLSPPPRLRHG